MDFLHVSPEMRPFSMIYIYIVGGGGFLMAVSNVMLQILRCNGYTKIGMRITFGINIVNIVGNYFFDILRKSKKAVSGLRKSTKENFT